MTDVNIVPASYKDPAGFVFTHKNGKIYRQVNKVYANHYDTLLQSGLYNLLSEKKLLIEHVEVDDENTADENCYKTLLPSQLEFISYPYEWSFDMLKDAALLTLNINLIALQKGMILKDATAFNIQFQNGVPLFIDTLSFEKYDETKPWIAYRQFCGHFLFPLLLNHYCRFEAQQLLNLYSDGLSPVLTSSLLPFRTRFNLGIGLHVHLQSKLADNNKSKPKAGFTKQKTERLLLHLQGMIEKLKYPFQKTTWNNYYGETILSQGYLKEKENVFIDFISQLSIKTALDIGANDGYFSQLLAQKQIKIVSTDFDGACINNLYQIGKPDKNKNILPLIIDISNPSPASGLMGEERLSFLTRGKSDLVIALALIHHLHFSNNIPLQKITSLFSLLTHKYLLIEFVPKTDYKVQIITSRKNDNDFNYSELIFEECFTREFTIVKKQLLNNSGRTLYLMEKIA